MENKKNKIFLKYFIFNSHLKIHRFTHPKSPLPPLNFTRLSQFNYIFISPPYSEFCGSSEGM
ncbi:hypothetical protein KSU1_C1103 [Candidatus Jettenia caeni]|uniref:Uncharacterized protein n=1 Tax=Candidatus Jettenia caeni TaxID=247490 RepID=I3ILV4_9BACT|nr:hypothetical protein KSU1_C1103 [Candidatus Jettenia caeni]